MEFAPGVRVMFGERSAPLVPAAVYATGDAVQRLLERLSALDDATLAQLKGATTDTALVIMGDASSLPWVDGLLYLGRDDRAPRLLLPTTSAPNVPPALLEKRLLELSREVRPAVLALIPHRNEVLSIDAVVPLCRESLQGVQAQFAHPTGR